MMAARALNMTWAEYADNARLPAKVADVLKAGIAMATAFVESLRYASVFDRIWPFAVHVPLHTIAVNIRAGSRPSSAF